VHPNGQPANAIALSGLTKRYGAFVAVKQLSLEVRAGEILGFLGLNGAGKTTTIRILLDLLRPTSGSAAIFGHDCQSDGLRARALIGYLPGEMGLYQNLTGHELLDLFAGLSGQRADPSFRQALQQKLELDDHVLQQELREYSTGMKRKLGIIQAFQSDPPLLILDEPTEGLDPLMQEAFYALVRDAKARGRTIFMSSHVLPEVEQVCDRVALLRKGELVLLSEVEHLRKLAARRVRVYFRESVETRPDLPPGHTLIAAQPRAWQLKVEGLMGPLLDILSTLPVEDLAVEEPRLEDVLIRYYREGSPP
jgi:ABC-2 type transport system ATP-binding protein